MKNEPTAAELAEAIYKLTHNRLYNNIIRVILGICVTGLIVISYIISGDII